MPRRLKGRLEVRRELRLYHHPAPKYTLCRSKSRTLCIRMHQLVLHWVQGRCIALRNVRTLGDFSATVVLRHYCHGRTLPTASGTLQLEKSVISCSTAPQLHSSSHQILSIKSGAAAAATSERLEARAGSHGFSRKHTQTHN